MDGRTDGLCVRNAAIISETSLYFSCYSCGKASGFLQRKVHIIWASMQCIYRYLKTTNCGNKVVNFVTPCPGGPNKGNYLCIHIRMLSWSPWFTWTKCLYVWMDVCMDGCKNALFCIKLFLYLCMDAWMRACMDGWKHVCKRVHYFALNYF